MDSRKQRDENAAEPPGVFAALRAPRARGQEQQPSSWRGMREGEAAGSGASAALALRFEAKDLDYSTGSGSACGAFKVFTPSDFTPWAGGPLPDRLATHLWSTTA